jgi:hypothetical protein
MMRPTLALLFSIVLSAAAPAPSAAAPGLSALNAAAQCRGTDRPINKRVRFARGRTTSVIKDTVRLCTSHVYSLRAREGQTMSVHLATGDKTSFTVYTPTDTVVDADGVKDWSGQLPETGQYQIIVATDATAPYTLEVTIR